MQFLDASAAAWQTKLFRTFSNQGSSQLVLPVLRAVSSLRTASLVGSVHHVPDMLMVEGLKSFKFGLVLVTIMRQSNIKVEAVLAIA